MPEETSQNLNNSVTGNKDFYPDLLLSALWLAAAIGVIYTSPLNTTLIRVILVFPVVMFIPGYCLIAALFPKGDDISLTERLVLSIGVTIAVVPMISLLLNFTPWGMFLYPMVAAVSCFTLAMILIALYRRSLVPVKDRFRLPVKIKTKEKQGQISPAAKSRRGQILNIVLAGAVLVLILTVIYVVTVPLQGDAYTEFFILGENRTATAYPDEVVIGRGYPMFMGVGNHEYAPSMYMVETWMMQTVFDNTTNTSRIVAMDPKERLELTLNHNETRIIPFNLTFNKSGYNRVEFLLFKDEVPPFNMTGMDRINNSYRELHLWITYQDE